MQASYSWCIAVIYKRTVTSGSLIVCHLKPLLNQDINFMFDNNNTNRDAFGECCLKHMVPASTTQKNPCTKHNTTRTMTSPVIPETPTRIRQTNEGNTYLPSTTSSQTITTTKQSLKSNSTRFTNTQRSNCIKLYSCMNMYKKKCHVLSWIPCTQHHPLNYNADISLTISRSNDRQRNVCFKI